MSVYAISPAPLSELTYAGARLRTDRLRGRLATAWDELTWLLEREAWAVLGYDSIGDWLQAEFGDLRLVKLSTEQRRDMVAAMKTQGMSVRAISRALGVSPTTVQDDAKPKAPKRLKVAEAVGVKTHVVVALIEAAGPDGLDVRAITKALGWERHKVSATLTRLARARRIAYEAPERRGMYGVYRGLAY